MKVSFKEGFQGTVAGWTSLPPSFLEENSSFAALMIPSDLITVLLLCDHSGI